MFTQQPGGLSKLRYAILSHDHNTPSNPTCIASLDGREVADITYIHLEDEVFLKGNFCSLKHAVEHTVRGLIGLTVCSTTLGFAWWFCKPVRRWTACLLLVPLDLLKTIPLLGNKLAAVWNRFYFDKYAAPQATILEEDTEEDEDPAKRLGIQEGPDPTEGSDGKVRASLRQRMIYSSELNVQHFPRRRPEFETGLADGEATQLTQLGDAASLQVGDLPTLLNFADSAQKSTERRPLRCNLVLPPSDKPCDEFMKIAPFGEAAADPISNKSEEEVDPYRTPPSTPSTQKQSVFESPDCQHEDSFYTFHDPSTKETVTADRCKELENLAILIRQKFNKKCFQTKVLREEINSISCHEERNFLIKKLLEQFSDESTIQSLILETTDSEETDLPIPQEEMVPETKNRGSDSQTISYESMAEASETEISALAESLAKAYLAFDPSQSVTNFAFSDEELHQLLEYSQEEYDFFKKSLLLCFPNIADDLIVMIHKIREKGSVSDEEENESLPTEISSTS